MQADLFPEVRSEAAESPDKRYTTRKTLAWCAKKAKVSHWHLDVAADDESHCAPKYYTLETNGLVQPWEPPARLRGEWNMWANVPWSFIDPWLERAWAVMDALSGRRGISPTLAMLLPVRTEQPFWHEHVEPFRDGRELRAGFELRTHFLPGRTTYGCPGNREGVNAGSPPFLSVLLVWSLP